ncbi:hypothetical protein FS749_009698 [Ceratobasidium sp. UAMH 11750]|nr:hypothetical protein FS749_009698 [Ceratobasidium sp. UAMH 11750]
MPAPNVAEGKQEPSYSRPLPDSSVKELFERQFLAKTWNVDTSVSSSAKRRALVIAVSYGLRSPPGELGGTYTDAYRIINLLVGNFGYPEKEICVLADPIGKDGEKNKTHWPSQENIVSSQHSKGFHWNNTTIFEGASVKMA